MKNENEKRCLLNKYITLYKTIGKKSKIWCKHDLKYSICKQIYLHPKILYSSIYFKKQWHLYKAGLSSILVILREFRATDSEMTSTFIHIIEKKSK